MGTPHFVTLAEIDEDHFISACRHGVIHLAWDRATIRFHRNELGQLASLLERAMDPTPPVTLSSGELRVTFRQDDVSELQLYSLTLLLSPSEFRELSQATKEAEKHLEEILSSGAWDEPEEQEAPPDPLQQLRRIPFSSN